MTSRLFAPSSGVSTLPQVGSIYNMGVWDKAAATWLRVDVGPTLDTEAAARRQYQVTGRSLNNGGCIAEPGQGCMMSQFRNVTGMHTSQCFLLWSDGVTSNAKP